MFDIKLKSGKHFRCDESSTILDAAKKAGVLLEYSCMNARCRSCLVKLTEGSAINVLDENVLTPQERQKGWILTCNSKPKSDLVLDVEDLSGYNILKPRTLPCKVNFIEKVSKDIIKLEVRLPPNANFNFLEGQYVDLIKGNIKRSYSISISNNENNLLEFIIKNYDKGVMSNYWFNEAKKDDLLRLNGPLGTFFYRNKVYKRIIFLATGTGIAPVKSILQGLENSKVNHGEILVFWGARYQEQLFLDNLPNVGDKFYKVVSRPESDWGGEIGYVQNVLCRKLEDLTNCAVYACGSSEMIESAKNLLTGKGLKEEDFYSDAFVSSN
ncbi:FAD-binding oxidoreductase [Flagellimonas sp. GZD32]|uniref:FAD-binding oxidoreductase n=1 Tax=Flagellimonas cixiensis TaxID=3228750 RepID=UPI0035C88DD9